MISASDRVITVTTETHLLIKNLYPGAGYNIIVFAISHGLYSEPHDYFQAVCEYLSAHFEKWVY